MKSLLQGNLGVVIGEILPAVRATKTSGKEGADFEHGAVVENVKNVVRYILNSSQHIADQVRNRAVRIAGAYYSITSSIVEKITLE